MDFSIAYKEVIYHTFRDLEIQRSAYISKPFLISPARKGIYKLFRALQICLHHYKTLASPTKKEFITHLAAFYRSAYISKPFVASPTKKGIYKLFRALQICLHHHTTLASPIKKEFITHLERYRSAYISKRFWYRLQRRGFINYLELYRSAYITIRLQHRLQRRSLSRIQSLQDLPTSPNHFWYRLQRRGFINYLELYRSAYITIGLQHRLQGSNLSRIQRFRDLPISPNHFWYRLQRRGFINYLELHRSAYITIRIQHRLQRRSLSRI